MATAEQLKGSRWGGHGLARQPPSLHLLGESLGSARPVPQGPTHESRRSGSLMLNCLWLTPCPPTA